MAIIYNEIVKSTHYKMFFNTSVSKKQAILENYLWKNSDSVLTKLPAEFLQSCYKTETVLQMCSYDKSVLSMCSDVKGQHTWRRVILIKFQSNFIEITLFYGSSPKNLLHVYNFQNCFL